MDENKTDGAENKDMNGGAPAGESESGRQHVHIFGAEVNSSSGDRAARREEWRKRRDEWKQAHREQREQWKMAHREWHYEHPHSGGLFWGLIVLSAGIMALLYTMGLVPPLFWHTIEPLWPVLLILWGASIILGRHWFARFVLFIVALALIVAVIIFGLVRADSPIVSYLSPHVVQAIQNAQVRMP